MSNLYVADEYNHVIRRVSPTGATSTAAGKIVKSAITGIVTRYPGFADGLGTTALFRYPYGIVTSQSTTMVYIADSVRARRSQRSPSLCAHVSPRAGKQRDSCARP